MRCAKCSLRVRHGFLPGVPPAFGPGGNLEIGEPVPDIRALKSDIAGKLAVLLTWLGRGKLASVGHWEQD